MSIYWFTQTINSSIRRYYELRRKSFRPPLGKRIEVPAGEVVVRQGDAGTQYFAVISGEMMVSIDGTDQTRLERGDGFGEIALLRDVPRAATVRAVTDAVLLAMGRDPFLTAVTGHLPTRDRATSIASGYVSTDSPRPRTDVRLRLATDIGTAPPR